MRLLINPELDQLELDLLKTKVYILHEDMLQEIRHQPQIAYREIEKAKLEIKNFIPIKKLYSDLYEKQYKIKMFKGNYPSGQLKLMKEI